MGEFPSGQRGQTVNLLRIASMVRIRPLSFLRSTFRCWIFCRCGRRIRKTDSHHAGGMVLPPVQKLVATLRCTHWVHRQRIRPPGSIFNQSILHPPARVDLAAKRALSFDKALLLVGEDGFEPSKRYAADLQSVPFGHSGTPPYSLYGLEPVDGLEPPTY